HWQNVRVPTLGFGAGHHHARENIERWLRALRRDRDQARYLPENIFANGPVRRSFDNFWPQQSRDGLRTRRAGGDRSGESGRELSENGRSPDGEGGSAKGETLGHQGNSRQRLDDRDRFSRAERVQAQDGLETSAQDRQGAVCANDRDPDVEQTSHSHSS